MRIAIIGAGAMGSLFGAMLSPVSDVYLIDPFEKHVRAINEKGLAIEKTDGSLKTYHLFATTDPSTVDPEIDLAIIFTKAYLTEHAAYSAKPLLGSSGRALTLQNGLGNYDVVAGVLGRERTIVGVTAHGGTMLGPGHIRHAGSGPTHIAYDPRNDRPLKQIVTIFEAAGIAVDLSENIDSLIWGKLVINVGINALAAVLRTPNGILGVTPECERIMAHAVSEASAVARALGISLPYDNPLEQVKTICLNTSQNRASMLQDVLRGAQTEIAVINAAIASRGIACGIPTPYNVILTEIIAALEATSENRIKA